MKLHFVGSVKDQNYVQDTLT